MVDARELEVRPRTEDDLAACAALAASVHASDGYPSFLGDATYEQFVAPEDALGAWVADDGGDVVGHVVLRTRSAPPSVALASSRFEVEPARLGFVARLMVDPARRRAGIARALLAVVESAARERDLVPVLDVVVRDASAIRLYEATGWTRLGAESLTMRDGSTLDLVVFAKP